MKKINTVPLHTELWDVTRVYGAPVGAQLTYRGGQLLTSAKVVTIFWGQDWVVPGNTLAAQINAFYDFILTSSLMDQLAEYSVPAYKIGHGSRIASYFTAAPTPPPPPPPPPGSVSIQVGETGKGTVQVNGQATLGTYTAPLGTSVTFTALPASGSKFVQWSGTGGVSTLNPLTVTLTTSGTISAAFTATGSGCLGALGLLPIHAAAAILRGKPVKNDPASTVTDAQIQSAIAQLIASGAVPKPDPNTLYMVHLASGITVHEGGDNSCEVFCGYHDQAAAGFFYGVLPNPDCDGCLGGLTAFDSLTVTTSHELSEAVTDPIPGSGWYDDSNGEVGDICAWTNKKVGQYTIQLEWSNARNACA